MILASRWAFWMALLLLVTPLAVALRAVTDQAVRDEVGAESSGSTGAFSPPHGGLDSVAGVARRSAPFRVDGRPSAVPYDPARSESPVPDYAPPKPALSLSGILNGPAPLALLEGIPGRDGPAVLGVGDTLGGLRVRRIKDGEVTVTGMDTTWALRLRQQ